MNSMASQSFSLPRSIVHHICHEWSPKVYQKLRQTCKYIFLVHPYTLTDGIYQTRRLHSLWELGLNKEVVVLDSSRIMEVKLWCIGTLCITVDSAQRFFSKIHRFDNLRLDLFEQNLVYEDLKLLSQKGTTHSLLMADCQVTFRDGSWVPVEDIMVLFYRFHSFNYIDNRGVSVTYNTFKNLSRCQPFPNLECLSLTGISYAINADNFCTFIKKNFLQHCVIGFVASINVDSNFKNNFETTVKASLRSWPMKPQLEFGFNVID